MAVSSRQLTNRFKSLIHAGESSFRLEGRASYDRLKHRAIDANWNTRDLIMEYLEKDDAFLKGIEQKRGWKAYLGTYSKSDTAREVKLEAQYNSFLKDALWRTERAKLFKEAQQSLLDGAITAQEHEKKMIDLEAQDEEHGYRKINMDIKDKGKAVDLTPDTSTFWDGYQDTVVQNATVESRMVTCAEYGLDTDKFEHESGSGDDNLQISEDEKLPTKEMTQADIDAESISTAMVSHEMESVSHVHTVVHNVGNAIEKVSNTSDDQVEDQDHDDKDAEMSTGTTRSPAEETTKKRRLRNKKNKKVRVAAATESCSAIQTAKTSASEATPNTTDHTYFVPGHIRQPVPRFHDMNKMQRLLQWKADIQVHERKVKDYNRRFGRDPPGPSRAQELEHEYEDWLRYFLRHQNVTRNQARAAELADLKSIMQLRWRKDVEGR